MKRHPKRLILNKLTLANLSEVRGGEAQMTTGIIPRSNACGPVVTSACNSRWDCTNGYC